MTTETFWTGVICFVVGEFVGMAAILFIAGAAQKPDGEIPIERRDNVVPLRREN